MKQLPATDIPHHGHALALIERTDRAGLFSADWPGCSLPGYIAAKIRSRPAGSRTLPTGQVVHFAAGEYLPAESEYGTAAWFFRCQDAARIKFKQVCDSQTARLTPSPLS